METEGKRYLLVVKANSGLEALFAAKNRLSTIKEKFIEVKREANGSGSVLLWVKPSRADRSLPHDRIVSILTAWFEETEGVPFPKESLLWYNWGMTEHEKSVFQNG